jgi:hypothetical protein
MLTAEATHTKPVGPPSWGVLSSCGACGEDRRRSGRQRTVAECPLAHYAGSRGTPSRHRTSCEPLVERVMAVRSLRSPQWCSCRPLCDVRHTRTRRSHEPDEGKADVPNPVVDVPGAAHKPNGLRPRHPVVQVNDARPFRLGCFGYLWLTVMTLVTVGAMFSILNGGVSPCFLSSSGCGWSFCS